MNQNERRERELSVCRKQLQEARDALQRLREKPDEQAGLLSRSSKEAYAAMALGIALAVFSLTWQLRAILFAALAFLCCDFAWRFPLGYRIGKWFRASTTVIGFVLIGWVGYKNVSDAYERELVPPVAKYIQRYGILADTLQLSTTTPPHILGSPASEVVVDGTALLNYADRYHLIAVAFHWSGAEDKYDTGHILKSNVFDIRKGSVQLLIPWNTQFIAEVEKGEKPTFYAALLVPKSMIPNSFDTVREAQGLGARVLEAVTGPP